VNALPNNIEIRFLRYSIQSNTPAFLGYSKNLKEDRKVMVSAFFNKAMLNNNKKLLSEIYQFLVEENSLTQSEKSKIENALRNN
jgi:tRNA A37 methylthiotransferase MiaB